MGSCLAKPPKGKEEPRVDIFPLNFTESRICDYYVDNLPARLQGDGLHLLRGGPGPIVLGWTHELLDESGVHSFQDRELLLKTRDKIVAAVELHRERRRQLKRGSLDGAASPSAGAAAVNAAAGAGAGAASGNSASAAAAAASGPACASGSVGQDGTLAPELAAADTAALNIDAAAHAAEAAAANTASILDSDGKPFHLTSDWLSADVPLYRISEERSLRRNGMSGIPELGSGRTLMQTVEPVPESPGGGDGGGDDGDADGGAPTQEEAEVVVVEGDGDDDGGGGAAARSPRAAARAASLAKSRLGRQPEEEGRVGINGDARDDGGGRATERDSDRGRDTFSPGLAPAMAEAEAKTVASGDVGETAAGDAAGRVVPPPGCGAKANDDAGAGTSSLAVSAAGAGADEDADADGGEGPHSRVADGSPLPGAVCTLQGVPAAAQVDGPAGGAAAPIPAVSCTPGGVYDGGARQGPSSGTCTATGGDDSGGSSGSSLGAESLAALTSLATPGSPPVASANIARSQTQTQSPHRHQSSSSSCCASSEADMQPQPQPQKGAATQDDVAPAAAGPPAAPTAQAMAHA